MECALRKVLALLRKPRADPQAVLANLTTAQATLIAAAQRSTDVDSMLNTLTNVIALVR